MIKEMNITRYYLYEVNDTKFHATVKYIKYKNDKDKPVHYGYGDIHTLDDTFRCNLWYNYDKITLTHINYESKCDFNTFFKEDHSKKLATYILGCFQFMIRMSPESEKISINVELNMDLGPQDKGYYRFYNLNSFIYAFYNKIYFEKYFNASFINNEKINLENKPDMYELLSWYVNYMDFDYFIKEVEPQMKLYSTTKDFLASFSPENYKGKDLFKDTYIWLTCYLKDIHFSSSRNTIIPTRDIWKINKIIKNVIQSDVPLCDLIIKDFSYFNKDGSLDNILLKSTMVYGDCVG